jgi:hypothetical protein
VECGPTINDARVSAKYPLGGEVNSTDVTVVVVQDSGHWIMEQQPKRPWVAGEVFVGEGTGTVRKKSPT